MLRWLPIRIACAAIAGICAAAGGGASAAQRAASSGALFSVAPPPEGAAGAVSGGPRIVLPGIVVAGERTTLAVLDAEGALVSGAEVELSGGERVRTDTAGRATFVAPAMGTVFSARLTGSDAHSEAPLAPAVSHNSAEAFADANITVSPRAIAVGEPFALSGTNFHGDVLQERVTLGNQQALLLAASPVSLVALAAPRAPLGETQITVFIGERSIKPRPVTVVSLAIAAQSTALTSGANGSLYVWVYGTQKPVLVEVRGLTPDVLNLPGGGVRRLLTNGGPANTARFNVGGVRAGDYAVSARLVPRTFGAPDAEGARRELMEARVLADMKWQKRLDPALQALAHAGAGSGGDSASGMAGIRKEILRLVQEHAPERVAESLRVAAALLDAD